MLCTRAYRSSTSVFIRRTGFILTTFLLLAAFVPVISVIHKLRIMQGYVVEEKLGVDEVYYIKSFNIRICYYSLLLDCNNLLIGRCSFVNLFVS